MRETHKVAADSREQRLAAYQYVFNVIFGITGTNSVDEFLEEYRKNDQANLRLLHNVSTLENQHQVRVSKTVLRAALTMDSQGSFGNNFPFVCSC